MTREFVTDVPNHPEEGRSAFSGVALGREIGNPYRVSGKEALELGAVRQLTGDLGRLCETNILEIWGSGLPSDQGQQDVITGISAALQSLMNKTVKVDRYTDNGISTEEIGLPDIAKRTFTHSSAAPIYQRLSTPHDDLMCGIFEPNDQDLLAIINGIKSILGVDLNEVYALLPLEGVMISNRVRYLVEACLILAKEICNPTYRFVPGCSNALQLIPDVRYGRFQFDALLTSFQESERDNVTGIQTSNKFNFLQFLQLGKPYALLEVKVPFRTSYTTGSNKLVKPIRRDLRDFYERLGEIALNWTARENTIFPFPELFEIVYLRGILSHAIHRIYLDDGFFHDWADLLEVKLKGGLVEDIVDSHQVGELIGILDQTEKRLRGERI